MQEGRFIRRSGAASAGGADRLLGALESEILESLWASGRASVRAVRDALNGRREKPIAYTTVLTVMQRLNEKAILDRRRVGNVDYYAPMQGREAFFATSSERIVRALVEDFGDIAIAQFLAELDRVDPEHLRELRRAAGHGDDDDAP